MPRPCLHRRRAFMGAAAGLAALVAGSARPAARRDAPWISARVSTDLLDVAYYAAGPENGRPVVLVHDFGYGVDSFARLAPILAAAGLRVLAPYARGHGGTRFRDPGSPRSGQQAALGKDLIDFIDALHYPEAVFAGFGWGAHAARAASVLRPTRCVGLVLAGLGRIDESGLWERYLFQSRAGHRDLEQHPQAIARAMWSRHASGAAIDAALFRRSAPAFANPDFGAILAHAWGSRHAAAAPDPRYAALERRFAPGAAAAVPAILLDPASRHLPHDEPVRLADAILNLVRKGAWRT
ncbi:alpha/beta fold hydrolase [Massilia sp. DD77]|uniref:alpha/beta fold hydrolase n=1 Tax=Massilia sp. DD77 TaxID=3109349 RepID=UPI002FFF0B39